VLDGRGSIDVRDIPEPEPGPTDIVVAPEAVGICGTDLHLAVGDYPGGEFPLVPGHEFAGTIRAVGDDVKDFAVGDRVCVDPNPSCGECTQCVAGATNLCLVIKPIGVAVNGACAELVRVPRGVVYRMPDGLDAPTGALVEPFACVLHAASRVGPFTNRRVLVSGAGSIGLLVIAFARANGAASIEVIEPSAVRRSAAEEFGADVVSGPGERDATRDIDLAVEASGHPAAVVNAINRLDNRGTLLQMGVVSPVAHIELFPYDLFARELSLIGSQSLATSFPAAVDAMAELPGLGARMVTDSFPLDRYAEALEAVRSDRSRKVQILPQA
jgi:2-desacetyl-2-hydroxyethyl bacteriochlorophyllide A dehydrogenase